MAMRKLFHRLLPFVKPSETRHPNDRRRYRVGQLIGTGTFGKVAGDTVAVKKLPYDPNAYKELGVSSAVQAPQHRAIIGILSRKTEMHRTDQPVFGDGIREEDIERKH